MTFFDDVLDDFGILEHREDIIVIVGLTLLGALAAAYFGEREDAALGDRKVKLDRAFISLNTINKCLINASVLPLWIDRDEDTVVLDLGLFLDENTWIGEQRLVNRLLDECDSTVYKKKGGIRRGQHWGAPKPGLVSFGQEYLCRHAERFAMRLRAIEVDSLGIQHASLDVPGNAIAPGVTSQNTSHAHEGQEENESTPPRFHPPEPRAQLSSNSSTRARSVRNSAHEPTRPTTQHEPESETRPGPEPGPERQVKRRRTSVSSSSSSRRTGKRAVAAVTERQEERDVKSPRTSSRRMSRRK